MTQLDMTTSTEASPMPADFRSSIYPCLNSTLGSEYPNLSVWLFTWASATSSCSRVMSTPMTRPPGPTSFDAMYASLPVPHPRSRTVVPSSSGGIGEPQP